MSKSGVMTGTSYEVLHKMETGLQILKDKLKKYPEAEVLQARCTPLLDMFREQLATIRTAAPNVEQLKGLSKGLEMASPVIMQHTDIWKSELDANEDSEKLHFAIHVINRIRKSAEEAHTKQREELLRSVGKLDGMVNSAMALLQKVEKYIKHHETKLQQQADLEAEEQDQEEPKQPQNGAAKEETRPTLAQEEKKPNKAPKKASPKHAK